MSGGKYLDNNNNNNNNNNNKMEEKRSSLPEKDGKKRRRRGGGIAVEEKKTDTSLRIEIVKEEGERETKKKQPATVAAHKGVLEISVKPGTTC